MRMTSTPKLENQKNNIFSQTVVGGITGFDPHNPLSYNDSNNCSPSRNVDSHLQSVILHDNLTFANDKEAIENTPHLCDPEKNEMDFSVLMHSN